MTRLQTVAAHLDEPVWGLSSLPPPADWAGPWTRLERDDGPTATVGTGTGTEADADSHADVTAGGTLHWAPLHHRGLATRMAQLAEWVSTRRPRLVVVDVSIEVAMLTRLMGIPTVVVALPGQRLDRAHRLAYDSASALLAPWPAGTHSHGWPDRWTRKTWCVGGISRFDGQSPAPAPAPGPTRRVLLLWGSGGRSVADAAVATSDSATPGWDWLVRDPVRAPARDLWADLGAADVVVTHAGQNAVAEVAAARRPAVVVAQPRPYGEQAATVDALNRLGTAVGLQSWPAPGAWPALLEQAVALGGDRWEQWSTGRGAQQAAAQLSLHPDVGNGGKA